MCSRRELRNSLSDDYLIIWKVCSGKTKYIINDIYDIIVKQIVYTDVVHHVLYSIAMQLVENSLYYCLPLLCFIDKLFSYYLLENAFIGYGFCFRREVVPFFNAMVKF